jgi:rod shape-determining protein MreB and related proteins
MFKPVDLYIDLGTANTLIYAKKHGLILNEASILGLKNQGLGERRMFALGGSAKVMVGKIPERSHLLRPLKEGVIADFSNTTQMLHSFLKQVSQSFYLLRPDMIISLPCQVTRHEREAVKEVGYAIGARKVSLLDEPVAAAIGSGLQVLEPEGQMIVDLGGGTTEAAVITLGGIVVSQAMRVGGEHIDQALMNHLKNNYHYVIGEQTAERIKIAVASALLKDDQNPAIDVGGIDLIKGLPSRKTVTAQMIFPVIDNFVLELVDLIKKTFEQCPPEIAGDMEWCLRVVVLLSTTSKLALNLNLEHWLK